MRVEPPKRPAVAVRRPTRTTVRTFYRGLASLQVGLLDDAQASSRTTELVPREPAAWADSA
jgi:hypothetical protein